MSSEVGNLYKRAGREAPVSGVTGLWILLAVWPARFVWFVKTNGALNRYWKSLGATSLSPRRTGRSPSDDGGRPVCFLAPKEAP